MKAKELKPGDLFTVVPPDPESPVRVCLTNEYQHPNLHNVRWGWPGKDFWCYMGEEVEVTLVQPAPAKGDQ